MDPFVSELRKINTDGLIFEFSKLSIEMFKNDEAMRGIDFPIKHFGVVKSARVGLSAWDIPLIEYLSVIHSNDYRRASHLPSLGQLVNSFRKYDNEHSIAPVMKNGDVDVVFRAILGLTAEQFQFQDKSWIFDKINRDYYILHAAKHFEHNGAIDAASIVKEIFGYSIDDYIAVLMMVFGLCYYQPEPLVALDQLIYPDSPSVLTKENISALVRYYSCSYEDLRKSSLGKQLLYSKPFILTKRENRYIASSLFLVAMSAANGLYWLVRDYYFKRNSQSFVNKFGYLFEDYIKDLANRYCEEDKWRVLPAGKEKGADFYFDFGSLGMLVESKTALLRLDAKQQVPNLNSINNFYQNNIREAYDQLQNSYKQFSPSDIPIIKVILLYDEFSNTAIMEKSMTEVFESDPLCYIMTIRDFEILLHLYHCDSELCSEILDEIIAQARQEAPHQTIDALLQNKSLFQNRHLQGEMDFMSHNLKRFENALDRKL